MTVLSKVMLGVSLALPIGPVSIEMIRRGLKQGFMGAFTIRLGGAIGNTLCLIGAYLGLAAIKDNIFVLKTLGAIGVGVLAYMGLKTLYNSYKFKGVTGHASDTNGWWLGFVLAVANPIGFAFWVGMYASDLDRAMQSGQSDSFMLNCFIIVGVLIWGATLSTLLGFGRRFVDDRALKAVSIVSGFALLYYAFINFLTLLG